MSDCHRLASSLRYRPLDQTSELSHIPRPVIPQQGIEKRMAGNWVCRYSDEVIDEGHDVSRPTSQGRNYQIDSSNTVVEVLSPPTIPHQLLGRRLGTHDDPHLHFPVTVATHTAHQTILQYPEELSLESEWSIACFVEVQGPTGSLLKEAPPIHRTGEGAAHDAKHLGFRQMLWEGRHVDDD